MKNKLHSLALVIVAALLIAGCATTSSWDPGYPDAATIEAYELAKKAVKEKKREDAQAALRLLSDNVLRLRVDTLSLQASLARIYGIENAVNAGDWDKALSRLKAGQARWGRSSRSGRE